MGCHALLQEVFLTQGMSPKLSGWRPPGRWDAARPWPWHEVGKEARVKALPVLTLKPWKQQGLPTSKAILGSKRRRVYMVRPGKNHSLDCFNSKMVAQTVKNLPAMQETQVRSLSQEDPLKKGMATHSSILS